MSSVKILGANFVVLVAILLCQAAGVIPSDLTKILAYSTMAFCHLIAAWVAFKHNPVECRVCVHVATAYLAFAVMELDPAALPLFQPQAPQPIHMWV